jgi:hypothetical protein
MRICRCCARSFQPLAHEHICDECADMNFISSPLAGINDRSTVAHCADSPSNILLGNPARGYFNFEIATEQRNSGVRVIPHDKASDVVAVGIRGEPHANTKPNGHVNARMVTVGKDRHSNFNRLLLFSCLPIDFAPEPLLRLEIGGNSGATLLKGI